MTYAAADTGTQSGKPVELYRFANGANVWTFSSGAAPVSYSAEVYAPEAIERGQIEASQEFGRAALTVTVPYDNAVAQLFVSGYPLGHVTLALFRAHIGDGEWITYWRGRVVSASFKGHTCELRCEPVYTTLRRAGLRAVYQLQCRHVLYGPGCGASAATHSVAGTVSAFVANQVFVAAAAGYPDDWFSGGYLETPHGSRLIMAHAGNSLTLSAAIPGLAAAEAVTVFAGCDHTHATCRDKFANTPKNGGFAWIPKKNPFSGDAIV